MKTYTEEELRKAYEQGAKDYHRSSKTLTDFLHDDVDEYIDMINLNIQPPQEQKVPITYGFLKSRISWEKFCEITGIDYYATREGYTIEDDEIFYLTESQVKDLF